MSRKSRLEALRARRAAGIASLPPLPEPEQERDPALGLPPPVYLEAEEPIPVPPGLKGAYRICGYCTSYVAGDYCTRCVNTGASGSSSGT